MPGQKDKTDADADACSGGDCGTWLPTLFKITATALIIGFTIYGIYRYTNGELPKVSEQVEAGAKMVRENVKGKQP